MVPRRSIAAHTPQLKISTIIVFIYAVSVKRRPPGGSTCCGLVVVIATGVNSAAAGRPPPPRAALVATVIVFAIATDRCMVGICFRINV